MSKKVAIIYAVECTCGEDLEIEVEDGNNVIKVTPCPACITRAFNEYKKTVKERMLIAVEKLP